MEIEAYSVPAECDAGLRGGVGECAFSLPFFVFR
jgi:hypothetical protein